MSESYITISGLKCPHCGGDKFVLNKERGELICVKCGSVVMVENIERGPEWRSFEGDERDRSRVGLPQSLLIQDKGLSTLIGAENEDSMGRKIAGKMKGDVDRLRKWQRRISVYGAIERNLVHALNELNKLGEKLDLPRDVLERASYIYRMALEKDLVRGRAIDTIIAAALYAALRYYEIPRTIREVALASGRSKKDLARCYRMLIRKLDLRMPLANPLQYVRRICVNANLDKRVMLEAEKIIKLAQKKRLTAGKDPVGLAAAAVYYACVLLGIKKTQRDIAIAANITEVTVRNRYKSLSDSLKLKEPVKLEELRTV